MSMLVTFVKNNSRARLVFLDLDFGEGGLNGIDIAKRLRREDGSVKADRISADGKAPPVFSCSICKIC